MEALINNSFFWGELYIPQLSNTSSATMGQAAISGKKDLDMYIAKYQKEYLIQMFGADLAADLPPELIALVVDEETKTSPIANAVYYHWMRANQTSTLPTGEKSIAVMNSIIRSGNEKMCRAWNEGVTKNRKIHEDLYTAETIVVNKDTDNEETLNWQDDIAANIDFTDNIFVNINEFNI